MPEIRLISNKIIPFAMLPDNNNIKVDPGPAESKKPPAKSNDRQRNRKMRKLKVDTTVPKYPRNFEYLLQIIGGTSIAWISFLLLRNLWTQWSESGCDSDQFRSLDIYLNLAAEVYGQEAAVMRIGTALKDHTGVTTMVFYGSVGTGKTFTANLIANHYPMADFHYYRWDAYFKSNVNQIADMDKAIDRLPWCRQQLVIIDNMQPADVIFFEDISRNLHSRASPKLKVIMIFVIGMQHNASDDYAAFEARMLELAEDSRTPRHVIKFRAFDEHDVIQYLQRKALPVDADSGDLATMAKSVNVTEYGFKRLYWRGHL